MGVEMAGLVSAKWGHLPAGPFKLLVRMAITCLDKPNAKGQPAGIYWGGWADLALALGRDIPDDDGTPETARRRKNIRDEVIRHTTALTKAGAIKPAVENPGRKVSQTWKLTL